ncbi:LANO_0H11716g1_1 [Lachancea nothofagi CBS 11611]|uniref:LANO_0H11716g1_1 n=1 Tax=Lachancea nothofagi CBS 11611 TaxID=1266666 RepID=A0A1G4KMC8_9SACH|nr:LANO_0H11716g1_1 [Lachancea nothofagi CBS 11611]
MPFVALLYTAQTRFVKSLAGKVEWIIKNLIDFVVTNDDEESTEAEDERSSEEIRNDPQGSKSLFPKLGNVDGSLGVGSSAVPCSLDFSTLQNPLSMLKTPSGHFEWQLTDSSTGVRGAKTGLQPISPESSAKTEDEDKEPIDQEAKKYVCHYCSAEFSIRGYLTRHIKKHAVEKAFHCPYYNCNLIKEERCHRNGGFSRRDTYKTHLRSRHFVYPKGVKSKYKAKSSGKCAHCDAHFESSNEWIKKHVETGECKGLPDGFKVAVKTGRRTGKLKMITTSNGHSRFISTDQSAIQANALKIEEDLETTVSIAHDLKRFQSEASKSGLVTAGGSQVALNAEISKNEVAFSRRGNEGQEAPRKFYGSSPLEGQQVQKQYSLPQYAFSYVTPSKETSLDEACFSVDPSPTEDAGLEAVNSSSSASSRISYQENQAKISTMSNNNTMLYSSEPVDAQDIYFHFPLDLDQSPMCNVLPNPTATKQSDSYDSKTVKGGVPFADILEKQMEAYALNERNLRENQQYLNFYNNTFNSHL